MPQLHPEFFWSIFHLQDYFCFTLVVLLFSWWPTWLSQCPDSVFLAMLFLKRLFLEICLLEQHTNKTTVQVFFLMMCKICHSICYSWCFSMLALTMVLEWMYRHVVFSVSFKLLGTMIPTFIKISVPMSRYGFSWTVFQ